MAGTVLENLSGRKLFVLTSIFLLCQVACFLIGGLIAPPPSNASLLTSIKCHDPLGDRTRWLYPRGKGSCHVLEHLTDGPLTANNVVFTFQIPFVRENSVLDFSRWQQSLIGILQPVVKYYGNSTIQNGALLLIDVRLGYRNKYDKEDDWKLYWESKEERTLNCYEEDGKSEAYVCDQIPFFELGSLHHDFYLLNIRLPVTPTQPYNKGIGKFEELDLVTIHQNGGFTKVWFSLKTIFTPIVLAILIWYWKRVQAEGRKPALLEKMILFLGIAMEFLNLPIEWLTLFFDMPYMLLVSDIRQGLFYAALLSFWLLFAGEHLMESGQKRTLQHYWKHLSAVAIGCVCLFLFDLCERGAHVVNPFHSLWATDVGTRLALSLIVAAGISASLYFIFLCWMIWRVFRNISSKRTALPAMSAVRRLHYQGIIYRFKFLMLTTLACAAMTVVGFILGQMSEDNKWHIEIELNEEESIDYTPAFYTGVYGMWNIYVTALLCLYAPSRKSWPPGRDPYSTTNSGTEEIEFTRLDSNTQEISALASFAKKVAAD